MNRMHCDNQTCNDQMNTMMENNRPSSCKTGSCPTGDCTAADWQGNECRTPGCTCYLAIANIPMQEWNGTYPVEKAFMRGTIFPELDLPFCGRRIRR